jgi:hypothetical protein
MGLDSVRIPRSHRVTIAVPLRVVVNGNEAQAEELTQTLLVSARGALIALAAPVKKGERLRIVHLRSAKETECTVLNTAKDTKDKAKTEVEIAFDEPIPHYWGLHFPPEDRDLTDRKRAAATGLSGSQQWQKPISKNTVPRTVEPDGVLELV